MNLKNYQHKVKFFTGENMNKNTTGTSDKLERENESYFKNT